MMKTTSAYTIATLALLMLGANSSDAARVGVFASALEIAYDGSTVTDSNPATGSGDLSVTLDVEDDGSPVVVGVDGSIDMSIPGVTGIPVGGGTVTSSAGGFLDISFDSGDFLNLNLGAVDVTYQPSGVVDFVFGNDDAAAIASQLLPGGVTMLEPVSVSFSTQADPATVTDDGSVLTGFEASGSGEAFGVPEPSTVGLLVLGGLFGSMMLSRYRLG